jgi:hypothetical protein
VGVDLGLLRVREACTTDKILGQGPLGKHGRGGEHSMSKMVESGVTPVGLGWENCG